VLREKIGESSHYFAGISIKLGEGTKAIWIEPAIGGEGGLSKGGRVSGQGKKKRRPRNTFKSGRASTNWAGSEKGWKR